MKMNNILKTTALLLGSSVLLSGCIKETFPESGYATSEQTAESPFAKEGLITAMPTVLITNYIDLGEHIDFGYPGIFGATDRMVGEVFPVSGNLPGGNQYYDRWQAWLYPGNSTGLAANGKMSPFFYTNYYKFIFTANEAIDIANQSEGAEEMMGIAKTFRALCYLDLARLYDALPAKAPERPAYETELEAVKGLTVPIVREDTSMEELENNPRVSREEMFKFIFEDLNTAETLLANYTPALAGRDLRTQGPRLPLAGRIHRIVCGSSDRRRRLPSGRRIRPQGHRRFGLHDYDRKPVARPEDRVQHGQFVVDVGHDPDHRHRAQQPAVVVGPHGDRVYLGLRLRSAAGYLGIQLQPHFVGRLPQKELCRSRPLVRRHRTLYDPDRGGVRNDSPLRIV